MRLLKYASFIFFMIFLSACYSSKQIIVVNSIDSNLNYKNDKVPLTIILYELNEITKFKEASIKDLLEREDLVLGNDKVDSSKFQLLPDTTMTLKNVKRSKSPYIGVLAIYTQDKSQKSKSAIKIKYKYFLPKEIVFEVNKDGVYMQKKSYKKKDLINGN